MNFKINDKMVAQIQTGIKDRDHLIDNAKVILIFLIILGHIAILFISKSNFYKGLFISIYTFHMPTFSFLSGIVASRMVTSDYVYKSMRRLIIPLIALQVIFELPYLLFVGSISGYTLNLVPYMHLDFLLCLFLWRLLLPAFQALRYPVAISIFISVVVGYNYGHELTTMRFWYFLPFFLMGNGLGKDFIHRLRFKGSQALYLGIISAVTLCSFYFAGQIDEKWLTGYNEYSALGWKGLSGGLIRLSVYPLGLITGIAFLGLVPRTENRLTHFGRNTMTIYLFEELYKRAFIILGFTEWIFRLPLPLSFLGFLILSGVMFYLTGDDRVVEGTEKNLFKPLEKLIMPWGKKPAINISPGETSVNLSLKEGL